MSWTEAEEARIASDIAGCVAPRPTEYDTPVRAVLSDLLELLRSSGRPPPRITPGYWPTFQVEWETAWPDRSLELFRDRIEVYRHAHPMFEVWEEMHVPGEGFSERFIAELPAPELDVA